MNPPPVAQPIRGFILLEVAITVAILGVGLVLVLQAFQTSLRANRRAQELVQTVWLAQARIAELAVYAEQSTEEWVEGEGDFLEQGLPFRWRMVPRRVEGKDRLTQVTLTIFRKLQDGRQQEEFTVVQEFLVAP